MHILDFCPVTHGLYQFREVEIFMSESSPLNIDKWGVLTSSLSHTIINNMFWVWISNVHTKWPYLQGFQIHFNEGVPEQHWFWRSKAPHGLKAVWVWSCNVEGNIALPSSAHCALEANRKNWMGDFVQSFLCTELPAVSGIKGDRKRKVTHTDTEKI